MDKHGWRAAQVGGSIALRGNAFFAMRTCLPDGGLQLWLCVFICGVLALSSAYAQAPAATQSPDAPAPAATQSPDAPERASRVVEKKAVVAKRSMVSAAHPLAVEAALRMLDKGGSAIDAAVAAQMVLTLVESQSSGIGGGGFLLHHDARRHRTIAYDGRETAPAGATPELFLDAAGKPMPRGEAVQSGKSVGVPGVLRALEAAHAAHGKLPWAVLFEPAIALAEQGYPMTERTRVHLVGNVVLLAQPATRALFYTADGIPRAVGAPLHNPAFAATARRIAREGADAFYTGALARRMVEAVRDHVRPGTLSEADLAAYRVRIVEPVCGAYRRYRICGMPPPSSGGIGAIQMLGILERFDLAALPPMSAESIHLLSEAGRLAYADRDRFVADDRFADVPTQGLIDPHYIAARSAAIRLDRTMQRAQPGMPAPVRLAAAADAFQPLTGTSHLSIVDGEGHAVSFTTSVDSFFGSQIFVNGYFLNNQLTDFSFSPRDADGIPVANAVYPGKRPRSTMSPVIIFAPDGQMFMLAGSPLGSFILNAVVKTIVGVIDWKLDIQAAVALPNVGSRNGPTDIERNTSAEAAVPALKKMGHEVRSFDIPTGLHAIVRVADGWQGGADPRREGMAKGQ